MFFFFLSFSFFFFSLYGDHRYLHVLTHSFPTRRSSALFLFKLINLLGQQGWFYLQIFRLADGKPADFKLGVFGAFWRYLADEYRQAWRVHRARRRQS